MCRVLTLYRDETVLENIGSETTMTPTISHREARHTRLLRLRYVLDITAAAHQRLKQI